MIRTNPTRSHDPKPRSRSQAGAENMLPRSDSTGAPGLIKVGRACRSAREDARLLRGELLVGEHALLLERGELLELVHTTLAAPAGRRCRLWRRRGVLLRVVLG